MNEIKENIAEYRKKIENFIDKIRNLIDDDQTADLGEKSNRLEIFDALLLLATFAEADKLNKELHNRLPLEDENLVLLKMCQKLQEINGICKCTLSDEHEIYNALFAHAKFLNADRKATVREWLSKEITDLIFMKTNTSIPHAGLNA